LKKAAFISFVFLLLAAVLVQAGPAKKPAGTDSKPVNSIGISVPVSCPDAELVQGTGISLPGLPASKTAQRLLGFAEEQAWKLQTTGSTILLKESSQLYFAFNNHLFFIYPSHNFW
jgi:hypothetical protein